jgi:large subunit ribosomal protein L17
MFRNMVTSLFKHDRIKTTDAKAKELRGWADHLVTLAKRGDLHARRQALSIVREKEVVYKLFDEAGERFGSVSGGYTRIVKLGRRRGDAAPVSIIELVAPDSRRKKEKKKKPAKTAETAAAALTPAVKPGDVESPAPEAEAAEAETSVAPADEPKADSFDAPEQAASGVGVESADDTGPAGRPVAETAEAPTEDVKKDAAATGEKVAAPEAGTAGETPEDAAGDKPSEK